jgi:hypothetical protein
VVAIQSVFVPWFNFLHLFKHTCIYQ